MRLPVSASPATGKVWSFRNKASCRKKLRSTAARMSRSAFSSNCFRQSRTASRATPGSLPKNCPKWSFTAIPAEIASSRITSRRARFKGTAWSS